MFNSIFLARRPKISTAQLSVWTALFLLPTLALSQTPSSVEEWNQTAIAFECGIYKGTFTGEFFKSNGEPTKSLQSFVDSSVKRKFDPKKDKSLMSNTGFVSPVCELFMLNALGSVDPDLAKSRCENVRDPLFVSRNSDKVLGKSSSGGVTPNFSLSSFSYSGSASQGTGDDSGDGACSDLDSQTDATKFGCLTQNFRDREKRDQKKALDTVLLTCAQLGVNMNDVRPQTQQALANAGLDAMGGGFCGQRGGGVTVIKQEHSNLDSVLSASLGALKVLAPMYVMNQAYNAHEKTARMAIEDNYKLGFPSADFAGSFGAYGGGYGYGGYGYGYGGAGYGYGNGYYGNGGVVVGGCNVCSGMGSGGYTGAYPGYVNGMVGGAGPCGVPPYAPWYSGCGSGGAVMGGPMFGGGSMGYPYAGNGYFPGNGWNFGQGSTGAYPWGGAGAYPYMGGAGAFPGPNGTLGGGNGWGNGANPYGYNGQFGQAPYWGANNGLDAQYVALQAQQWQQQAMQAAQAAAQASQKAQLLQSVETERDKAMNEWNAKAYQAWMSYQMAAYSVNNGVYTGTTGTIGGAVPMTTGIYNPGFSSGSNLNLNGAFGSNPAGSAGFLNFNYNSRSPSGL